MQDNYEAAGEIQRKLQQGVARWANVDWDQLPDPTGSAHHALISRILTVISPDEVEFAAGSVSGGGLSTVVEAAIYTATAIVVIHRDQDSSFSVVLRPRSGLRAIDIVSAPIVSTSDWNIRSDGLRFTASYDWGEIPFDLERKSDGTAQSLLTSMVADISE